MSWDPVLLVVCVYVCVCLWTTADNQRFRPVVSQQLAPSLAQFSYGDGDYMVVPLSLDRQKSLIFLCNPSPLL